MMGTWGRPAVVSGAPDEWCNHKMDHRISASPVKIKIKSVTRWDIVLTVLTMKSCARLGQLSIP